MKPGEALQNGDCVGGGGGGGGGGGIEDLSARLESQIQEMEQQLGGIDRDYKQQLSTNVSGGMG